MRTNMPRRHTLTSMNTTSPSILDGFGFDSQRPDPKLPVATPERAEHEAHTHRPLVRGSVAARALYEIVDGSRVVLVDAPPGGGKTSVLTTLLSHLANRFAAGLPVVTVATPTRAQAASLYERLVEFVHPAQIDLNVKNLDAPPRPEGALAWKDVEATGRGKIEIRTLASLRMMRGGRSKHQGARRILLVDEGYQATFADVASAASTFDQVVMVGDPGQIGPVVTVDTGAWESLKRAPHRRAPEAFATMDFTVRLAMDSSYRLGPQTVAAIAPIYPFAFDSARPERHLLDADGAVVPELAHVAVTDVEQSQDVRLMQAVVDRVRDLVGSTAVDTDSEGVTTTSPVTAQDVAVVVALNTQVTMLTGMLAACGLEDVTVGTADRLQGGEWRAVVALDPMAGGSASVHHLSIGRLCVMASRHTTHLTWVHDGTWGEALDEIGDASTAARVSRKVREALTRTAL